MLYDLAGLAGHRRAWGVQRGSEQSIGTILTAVGLDVWQKQSFNCVQEENPTVK